MPLENDPKKDILAALALLIAFYCAVYGGFLLLFYFILSKMVDVLE